MARNALGAATELVPAGLLTVAGACVAASITSGALSPLLGAAATIYLAPPLLHRLHDRFFPLVEGRFEVVGGHYLPWWGSHQLNRLFIAYPFLEATLRLVPGLYSAWLRLWGARIGRGVYWTPGVKILDRALLVVGDGVVFGEESGASGHVISFKQGKLMLLVGRVTVEDRAIIGGQAGLAPGSVVKAGVVVAFGDKVGIDQVRA
jgi:hypothetical protein